jgi:hypothetical protein
MASRRPPSYFTDLFINSPKGMNAYWREVSYGNISLDGTQVFGWRKLSQSTAQLQAFTRAQKASAAANAFANDPDAAKRVDFSQFYGVIAIFDPDIDFGATGATLALANGQTFGKPALVAAQNHDTGGHAHEMGHTLGLDHSFDDASVPVDPADDGRPGAYGDLWDAMSYGNNFRFDNSPWLRRTGLECGTARFDGLDRAGAAAEGRHGLGRNRGVEYARFVSRWAGGGKFDV